MKRPVLFVLSLLAAMLSQSVSGQKMYIHCDKSLYLPGDTIWWKAYVLDTHQRLSGNTNLHVELFNNAGNEAGKAYFPVVNGQSIGQLATPDSSASGVYWLLFFSGADPGEQVSIPISVYHRQDDRIVLMKKRNEQLPGAATIISFRPIPDTKDYRSWQIRLDSNVICHCSVSVTNASESGAQFTSSAQVGQTGQSRVKDTAFLSWQGSVFKKDNQKVLRNTSLMALIVKDSVLLTSRVIPVDTAGRFQLDDLFFFGQATLLYQLNRGGAAAKDVRLALDSVSPPPFQVPEGWIRTDSLVKPGITNQASVKFQDSLKITGKQLKEVKIRGWKSHWKELDHQYTTGAFSEPALYSFDLRNEKLFMDLGTYLRANLPGFQGGATSMDKPFMVPDHPLLFYVDEELKTWDELDSYRLEDIAYIKAFENSFIGDDPFTKLRTGVGGFSMSGSGSGLKVGSQPTPMIVSIYTRKGKDKRHVPGLNALTIAGYTPIARFQPSEQERTTRLWEPLIDANSFLIKLARRDSGKPLRFTIAGFTDEGKEIYYQTVITPN